MNITYLEFYLVNNIGSKYIFTTPYKIHVYVDPHHTYSNHFKIRNVCVCVCVCVCVFILSFSCLHECWHGPMPTIGTQEKKIKEMLGKFPNTVNFFFFFFLAKMPSFICLMTLLGTWKERNFLSLTNTTNLGPNTFNST